MWRSQAAAAVCLIIALLGCDQQKATPPPPKTSASAPSASADAATPVEPVDLSDARKAFAAKLGKSVGAAEKADKKKTKCPATISGKLHVYALPYAKHIATGAKLDKTASEMTAFRPPQHKVLDGDAKSVPSAAAARLSEVLSASQVALVVADKLVLPALDDDKSFLSGELEGWVHVVALGEAKVLCTAPLSFLSSEKVEWTESLSPEQAAQRFDLEKSDASFHVRVDFFVQGHAAVKKSIAEIGPGLELELR